MVQSSLDLEKIALEDQRILQLVEWLSSFLDKKIRSIEFASEDASFRRYFRIVHENSSYILMDAPVEHMDIEPFLRIAEKFLSIGLNVPTVFASNKEKGFALISDFGNTMYLDILTHITADELYEDALNSLIRLQVATSSDPNFLPPYDAELLCSEMELFRSWYLPEHRKLEITPEISDVLDHTFEFLRDRALEQPKVWVHLDYHSRNLMHVADNNPGIIDFQSAVLGPITYDLVSLLRDCYIVWPPERVRHWIHRYFNLAHDAGLSVEFTENEFMQWFDWMGLQRHIKVVGIFSRLNYRDHKAKFLEDIPTVMTYIEFVSRSYKELKPLHRLVTNLIEN